MDGMVEGTGRGDEVRPDGEVAARTSPMRLAVAAVVVVAVVAAIVAAASSGGNDELPVIRLGAAAGTGDGRLAAESDEAMATADMMVWDPVAYRFELRDGADVAAGEAAAWRLNAPGDLEAAAHRLAERLGVDGVEPSPYDAGSFHGGPLDGSGPTLWVGSDGSWSFFDPGGQIDWSCAPAEPAPDLPDDADLPDEADLSDDANVTDDGDAPDRELAADDGDALVIEPDPAIADCPAPPAPDGVPTADEARALATTLFDDLDVPGDVTIHDVSADDWGAWVGATVALEGVPTDLWMSASWGGDALLTSVSGTLAVPERVGAYPTVDAATAVERLEGRGFGLPMRGGELAVEMDVAEPMPADGAAVANRSEPAEIDPNAPVSDAPATDEPVEEPLVDPMPTEPMPIDPLPEGEVEEVTITLVDVESVLLLQWDADGAVWLLPGYRFTDTDGGQWQVIAVADEYVDADAEPTDAGEPEPGIVDPGEPSEPGTGGSGGSEPGEPGTAEPIDPGEGGGVDGEPGEVVDPMEEEAARSEELAQSLLGLSEDDALNAIDDAGSTSRIVARDGERFEVTMDYSPSRINLEIEDGRVTAATVG